MLIYLLHFDENVRGKRHYLGSCEAPELDKRLRRHQLGTGSNLTKKAHEMQVGFTLSGLWKTENRDLEKRYKVAKHYDLKCSCCRRDPSVLTMFDNVLYFAPIAQITPVGIEFPQPQPR